MVIRYDSTATRAARRAFARLPPFWRAATVMLAASLFTSHSKGPGSVSSKSFTSKRSVRSGEA